MTRKTIEAYVDVFHFLKNKGIEIKNIMTDFEPASRRAAQEVFPDVKLWGCQFHFGQVSLNSNWSLT